MIGYLKGTILENSDGKLIVATGADCAVGYAVSVPQSAEYLDHQPGKQVELFVHTHVREDALDLYGFASRSEKDLYLSLLSVTGIGPKGALGILSKVPMSELIHAIVTGDKDSLTQVPGIGKKTAERVVMELADKVRKKVDGGGFATAAAASFKSSEIRRSGTAGDPSNAAMLREAKTALIGLGYREQDIGPLLNRVLAESENRPRKVEDLIRKTLQQLV
jgi:holliday junction DNA helicase RuvA